MKKLTPQMIAGWLATITLIVTALLPVLPDSSPFWVRNALVIVGVIVAALTHSPLLNVVPVPEAPKPIVIPVAAAPAIPPTNPPPPPNGPAGTA